jgi:hypothetical protein
MIIVARAKQVSAKQLALSKDAFEAILALDQVDSQQFIQTIAWSAAARPCCRNKGYRAKSEISAEWGYFLRFRRR